MIQSRLLIPVILSIVGIIYNCVPKIIEHYNSLPNNTTDYGKDILYFHDKYMD